MLLTFLRFSIVACTVLLTGCIGAGANTKVTVSSEHSFFPQLKGSNLLGESIDVPTGLNGERRLIISAYLHEQQREVDTWIAQLDSLKKEYGDFDFYELPVIEHGNAMFRLMVNNGMRSGIKEEAKRRSVVTIFTEVADYRSALGIESTATIDIFLLDKSGKIHGRTRGTFSADKAKTLFAN